MPTQPTVFDPGTVAAVLAAAGSILGIIVSITVLITFRKNSHARASEEGAYRQKQEDRMSNIERDVKETKLSIREEFGEVKDQIKELALEQKNANARMIQIITHHQQNHPGQKIV